MEVASRVYAEDSGEDAANKIFYFFEVNQSCTIFGFQRMQDESMEEKGNVVLEELRKLDRKTNFQRSGKQRRRKILPNTIGDWIAQKAFRWARVVLDGHPKYTIWRCQ